MGKEDFYMTLINAADVVAMEIALTAGNKINATITENAGKAGDVFFHKLNIPVAPRLQVLSTDRLEKIAFMPQIGSTSTGPTRPSVDTLLAKASQNLGWQAGDVKSQSVVPVEVSNTVAIGVGSYGDSRSSTVNKANLRGRTRFTSKVSPWLERWLKRLEEEEKQRKAREIGR